MNIIWLCSWYPNTEDKFRGDFIQRQAVAVSAFVNIEVLHVVFCDRNEESMVKVNSQLTENIFYIKKKNKITDRLKFYAVHNRFLKKYREQNGLPALVHVQIPLQAGMIAMQWKNNFNIPYVLTEHYGIYNSTVEDNFLKRNFLFRYFTKKVIRQASRFLPVSKSLGTEVNEMVIQKDFTDVPNVVDTSLFHFEEKIQTDKIRFVHVSNMAALKNVKGMLDALAIVAKKRNDFECIFIGNKPQDILAYAKSLQLDSYCRFESEVPYAEVATLVKQCHAGILFSTSESQSCVVLEWLCSGLPVISSAVGGVVELINNDNGILVSSMDVTALADTIDKMIDNYKNYDCKSISVKAISLYSYEAVGRKFYSIYKEVVRS